MCNICLNNSFIRNTHQSFQLLQFSPPFHLFPATCFPGATRPPRLGEALRFSPSRRSGHSRLLQLRALSLNLQRPRRWQPCPEEGMGEVFFEKEPKACLLLRCSKFLASEAVEEVFEVWWFCFFVHFKEKVSKYSFSHCVVLGSDYWLIQNQHWPMIIF